MESQDRIVNGLQQLHDDLEKLRSSVGGNYEHAATNNQRNYRRMVAVYLMVVAGFVGWTWLSHHHF